MAKDTIRPGTSLEEAVLAGVDATALADAKEAAKIAYRYALGAALIIEHAAREAKRAEGILVELAAEEELGERFEILERAAGLPNARHVLAVEASWLDRVVAGSKELANVTADQLLADSDRQHGTSILSTLDQHR